MYAFLIYWNSLPNKIKISSKCSYPQAIQYVNKFVSSLEQIWRNVALHHMLSSGFSTVNEWVQTDDTNKSIIYSRCFLTSNHCFWLRYVSTIHNIAFSNMKVISSESGEKYAQLKHKLTSENSPKLSMSILMWEDNMEWSFVFY